MMHYNAKSEEHPKFEEESLGKIQAIPENRQTIRSWQMKMAILQRQQRYCSSSLNPLKND